MDVQTIFYTMGIVFMSLMFIIMIGVIILLFYIKNKVNQLSNEVIEKISLIASVAQYTSNIAGLLGGKFVETAAKKVKDIVEKKTQEKK